MNFRPKEAMDTHSSTSTPFWMFSLSLSDWFMLNQYHTLFEKRCIHHGLGLGRVNLSVKWQAWKKERQMDTGGRARRWHLRRRAPAASFDCTAVLLTAVVSLLLRSGG